MDMKEIINNFSEMLSVYDSQAESERLAVLLHKKNCMQSHKVVDIGCGNGRFEKIISLLLPSASIVAIDKIAASIDYAINNHSQFNIKYIAIDAFDFFPSAEKFDIAFFSWSFFDMNNDQDANIKKEALKLLLDKVKKSLNERGLIVVLQPTKGGTFEKLLSKFLPSSDADYLLTHNFLLDNGFVGPQKISPSVNDPLAIWSKFNYKDDDQLFRGIASILALECGEELARNDFDRLFAEFKREKGIKIEHVVELTDCVNIYYLVDGYK